MLNQALTAYVNNELNKNNLHIANDYVVDKPSDRQFYNEPMKYYSSVVFRPVRLDKGERAIGKIFLKGYSDRLKIALTIGHDVHYFRI